MADAGTPKAATPALNGSAKKRKSMADETPSQKKLLMKIEPDEEEEEGEELESDEDMSVEDEEELPKQAITDTKCKSLENTSNVATPDESKTTPAVTASNEQYNDNELDAARAIWVKNLPTEITIEEVKKIFNKYGEIKSINFCNALKNDPRKRKTAPAIKKEFHKKRSNIKAYVLFASTESALKALEMNGSKLEGYRLNVNMVRRCTKQVNKLAVFLRNFPVEASEDDVYKIFSSCGEISKIDLVRNMKTGNRKRIAFVHFTSTDSVELALLKTGERLMGRTLTIRRCLVRPKKGYEEENEDSKKIEVGPEKENNEIDDSEMGFDEEEEMSNEAIADMKHNSLLNTSEVVTRDTSKTTPADSASNEQNKDDRTIFVANLPDEMTSEKLEKIFNKYGKIESLSFGGASVADPTTPKTVAIIKKVFNRGRNYLHAYIVFASTESALKALEMNGTNVEGHFLRVGMAIRNAKPDKKLAVYVGNVGKRASEYGLRKIFTSCGEITHIHVVKNTKTGEGKGFAFVHFMSIDSVKLAMLKNGAKFMGRPIKIKYSLELPARPEMGYKGENGDSKKSKVEPEEKDDDLEMGSDEVEGKEEMSKEAITDTKCKSLENTSNVATPDESKTIPAITASNVQYNDNELDAARAILVKNLPIEITIEEVKKIYNKYGEIESIDFCNALKNDPQTPKTAHAIKKEFRKNRNNINAFVVFASTVSASKALKTNKTKVEGHHLNVKMARKYTKQVNKLAIFVENLPLEASDDAVYRIFKSCGEISQIDFVRNMKTGNRQRIAFVNFKSTDSVELALLKTGVRLIGRELIIRRCLVPYRPKKGYEGKNEDSKKIEVGPEEEHYEVFDYDSEMGFDEEVEMPNETNSIFQSLLNICNFATPNATTTPAVTASNEQKENDIVNVTKTIFVRKLPIGTTIVGVKKIFNRFGEIESVYLFEADPRTPKTAHDIKKEFHKESSNKNAFVVFTTTWSASKALKMNGTNVEGHRLNVKMAGKYTKQLNKFGVCVENLPDRASNRDLFKIFESCGEISCIHTARNGQTGIRKGVAYVYFTSTDSVELALLKTGEKLMKQQLSINRCHSVTAKPKKRNEGENGDSKKNEVGPEKQDDDDSEMSSDEEEEEEEEMSKEAITDTKCKSLENTSNVATPDATNPAVTASNELYKDNKFDFARTIWVKKLPRVITIREVKKIFRNYGEIKTLKLHNALEANPRRCKTTQTIKSELYMNRKNMYAHAYILFATSASAIKALEMNGAQVKNRRIQVYRSRRKTTTKCTVVVGNVPSEASKDDLSKVFTSCGEISHIRVVRDETTGIGNQIAHVTFMYNESVEPALLKNGEILMDRKLSIRPYHEVDAKPENGYKREKGDSKKDEVKPEEQDDDDSEMGSDVEEGKEEMSKETITDTRGKSLENTSNVATPDPTNPAVTARKEQHKDNKFDVARAIWVENLPRVITIEEVKKSFDKYGEIKKLHLRNALEANPRRCKTTPAIKKEFEYMKRNNIHAYAYILFATSESAVNALEMNGAQVKGRQIQVGRTRREKITKCTVVVGNVPLETSEDELIKFFTSCGDISHIRVVSDETNGIKIAYVTFMLDESVEPALLKNDEILGGRKLSIRRYFAVGSRPKNGYKRKTRKTRRAK